MARTELLAHANKGVPWVPPVEGQEIEIPAVVTYLAGEGETVNTIAARFWGDPNRGWELNTYNRREGVLVQPRRGRPRRRCPACGSPRRDGPRRAPRPSATAPAAGWRSSSSARPTPSFPQLLADVRYGRYAEAVARGNRLARRRRAHAPAARRRPPRAARGLRRARRPRAPPPPRAPPGSRTNPNPVLDPVRVSPKIRAACDAR